MSDIGPLFDEVNKTREPINQRLLAAARLGAAYLGVAVNGDNVESCVIPGSRSLRRIEDLIAEAEGHHA